MKKLFVIAAAAGLSFAATASTVTWGAQDADTIDSSKFTGETFTADTLKTAGLDKTVDTFEYSSTSYKKKNNAITPTSAGISGNGLTLYEVLISSDGKNLAWGTTTANIVAAAGLNQTKTLNSFTYVAASNNVPEPTSGLLLLVGGAMLALRRKRK